MAREITMTLYSFDELSDEAKQAAYDKFIRDYDYSVEVDMFYEDIKDQLTGMFPNSELDVQFDYSYSQGSGLNIYGKLKCTDALDWLNTNRKISAKTYSDISKIPAIDDVYLTLLQNHRYTFSMISQSDFQSDFYYQLDDDDMAEYEDSINTFDTILKESLEALTTKLYNDGADFFDMSIDDFADRCRDIGMEFEEDGTAYY